MLMNAQEQNWTNLFGNSTPEGTAWYGIWTRYSPEKQVIDSFRCVRKFSANEDKTIVTHTNTYTYNNGKIEEKSWQIEKQKCNQPDGLMHIALPGMRTLAFDQGANAGVSTRFELGQKFGTELFFRHQEWRTSVAIIYDENGNLEKMTHIQEHLNSYPEKVGAEIKQISGKWRGERKSMHPDLTVLPAEDVQELVLAPTKAKNQTISLPDGIVINTPKILSLGEEFEIIAGKLLSENLFQRLIVKYDQSGKFMLLTSEVFNLIN